MCMICFKIQELFPRKTVTIIKTREMTSENKPTNQPGSKHNLLGGGNYGYQDTEPEMEGKVHSESR